MKAMMRAAVSGVNLSRALRRGAERVERSARMTDARDFGELFVGRGFHQPARLQATHRPIDIASGCAK
jgi:hypothetical protein